MLQSCIEIIFGLVLALRLCFAYLIPAIIKYEYTPNDFKHYNKPISICVGACPTVRRGSLRGQQQYNHGMKTQEGKGIVC